MPHSNSYYLGRNSYYFFEPCNNKFLKPIVDCYFQRSSSIKKAQTSCSKGSDRQVLQPAGGRGEILCAWSAPLPSLIHVPHPPGPSRPLQYRVRSLLLCFVIFNISGRLMLLMHALCLITHARFSCCDVCKSTTNSVRFISETKYYTLTSSMSYLLLFLVVVEIDIKFLTASYRCLNKKIWIAYYRSISDYISIRFLIIAIMNNLLKYIQKYFLKSLYYH